MTSPALHRLAIFALTVAVALPIAPRELVVLCLGADGHVAVESASSDTCRDDLPASAGEGQAFCSDGCGPCTDVRLISGDHASGRPSNELSVLEPLSAAATPAWSLHPASFDDRRFQVFVHARLPVDGGISSRAIVALLI